MAITIIAGKNTYPIAFAAATTGAAGSETPDGNTVYFNPVDWNPGVKPDFKRKTTLNGASAYPTGKRDIQCSLNECRITADIGGTTTAELNLITDFLYDYGVKKGSTKGYLFIKHVANAVYEKLSWSSGDVHQQFIKCLLLDMKWECSKGKLYTMNLKFGEATTP